jgi:hypothetical protein
MKQSLLAEKEVGVESPEVLGAPIRGDAFQELEHKGNVQHDEYIRKQEKTHSDAKAELKGRIDQ